MRTSSVSRMPWIAVVVAGCVIALGLAGGTSGSAHQDGSIRFAIIGDYGWTGQPELDVANLVKSWEPEFIITVGDNNYTDGAASTIDPNIGQYYHEFIYPYTGVYGQGAPFNRFFPSLGNHDWETPGAQPYLDYFGLPGNERYYDFAQGPVRFFAVDSDPREPDGITVTSTQAIWLQNRLGATNETWKLLYFHHPPYSSGPHGGTAALRWPYRQWGADGVLTGHDHTYERIVLDGFPYIINGLGGRSITNFGTPVPGSVVRYNGDYGAMLADAGDNSITFQFFSRAGALIDTYSITSTVATATAIATSTNTPQATSTPPTLDLVGNWEPYYYACDNLGFFLNVRTEPYNPSTVVPVTTTMYFNGATFVVPPFTGSYSRQCSGGPCSRSIVFNTLVVDYNNDVAETNEDNNVHSGSYFFGPMCTPIPPSRTSTATPTPTGMPSCCTNLTGGVLPDCFVTTSGASNFRGIVEINNSCTIVVPATIQSFLEVSPNGSAWQPWAQTTPRPIMIAQGPPPYSVQEFFSDQAIPTQYAYYRIASRVQEDVPCSANVFTFVSSVQPICRQAATGTVTATPSVTATLTPTIGPPCGALPAGSSTSCIAPSTYNYSFTFYSESGCQSSATGSASIYFEAAPSASGPFTTLDTQGRTVTFPPGPSQVTFTGTLTETNIPSQYTVYRISFSAASVRAGAYGRTQISPLCNTGGSTVTVTPGTPQQATATRTSTVATPTSCALQFGDVPPYNTFYSYVRCLACRGIISGYNDGTFRPNNDITRGQIAKIVSQSAGFSDPAGTQIYEDVPPASPFFTWIQRLSNRGLVGGYPCGMVPEEPCVGPANRPYFRPNASATRGQLSKIVASARGLTSNPTGETYQDVPSTHTFYVWIEQLSNLGVMGGYPCGTVPSEPCGTTNKPYFRPANNVTRGQASKIVANTFFPGCQTPEADLCDSIPPSVDMEITPDNCQAVGARFEFVGSGFQPGESITVYVTDPSGNVFGGAEQLIARPDGTTEPFAFQTQADFPTGRWSLTMQGESSGHEAVGYFGIYSP